MIFKDYYKILGLETNKVNKEEIKNSYRILAKKYHPDINIQNPKAEERFKDINEAYQVLTNDSAKRKYDRIWRSNRGSKTTTSKKSKNSDSLFSDFFGVFFGEDNTQTKDSSKNGPIKGEDIETEISVTLEEVFYGSEKKIALRTIDGKMKNIAVKIPAGIRNNEKIRIAFQGKPGKNGGENGDLFIKIKILDHSKYKLKGSDLYTDLKIAPWEAALGTRLSIPSLDGNVIVFIPPGISSGEKIRLPKKGYMTGFGDRGDLIAQVQIAMPKNFTEKETQLFQELQKVSSFVPREQEASGVDLKRQV